MAWIKRNLYFLIGGGVALALLGAAIFYLYTQNQKNNELTAKLTEIIPAPDRGGRGGEGPRRGGFNPARFAGPGPWRTF